MELYFLLLLIIVGSVYALQMKDILSSIFVVGALGLCLSVIFLLLKAPDVAMTQLAAEIVLMIILIRASMLKDDQKMVKKREFFKPLLLCVFMAVMLAGSFFVIKGMRIFGKPIFRISQSYIESCMQKTSVVNVVTAIMFDFRAMDGLATAAVFFAAIIGVMVITGKNK